MTGSSKLFTNASEAVAGTFRHWMKHHPIISNSLLCLNLWIAGDFVAQYSEFNCLKDEEEDAAQVGFTKVAPRFLDEYEVQRTAKCASFGALVTGPILATWYPFLERMCVSYNVAARYGVWGAPVIKVLADEFIMDPPFIFLFYGYMNILEDGTWESFEKKMRSQFIPSWLASLAVWPWVLLGTFRYVPIYAHAPVINACCVVWDGYLSHRNTLSKLEGKEEKK